MSSLSAVNENRLEVDDAGLYLGQLGLSAVYSTTSKCSYQLNTDSSRAVLRPRLIVCVLLIIAKRKHWVAALHLWMELCGNVTGMNLLQCPKSERTNKNACFSNIIQTILYKLYWTEKNEHEFVWVFGLQYQNCMNKTRRSCSSAWIENHLRSLFN